MRTFLIVLVLIFSFLSLTKADVIEDFEIDGYTLNESLLKYFSKEELKANWKIEKNNYGFKSKKFFKFAFEIKNPGLYENKIIIKNIKSNQLLRLHIIQIT